MKAVTLLAVLAPAVALASAGHRHHHQHLQLRHSHKHPMSLPESAPLEKKSGIRCSLPDHPDLHHVPGEDNNGFAMSPNQPCTAGMYCPIACKSGKVMAQWEPDSTYTYPSSMNGGLYCDDSGKVHKPYDSAPYCKDGAGTVKVKNTCGKALSFCQTVLPGNEAMLIPTIVDGEATLAVPDTSYWCGTSAHYYVNPPGSGEGECIWGDSSKARGNWAPFIAGANMDGSGRTFVTLGINPIWQHEGNGLEQQAPGYGLKVQCQDGCCNGTPCSVGLNGAGSVTSNLQAVGAGDSSYCVVTVNSGCSAEIVVVPTDGSAPTSHSDSSSSSAQHSTTSSTQAPTSTSTSLSSSTTSTSRSAQPSNMPGIFHENSTSHEESDLGSSSRTATFAPTSSITSETATTESPKNEGGRQQGSAPIGGLIVALVAAAYFY